METSMQTRNLLLKHGFKETATPNAFSKYQYKAVVWEGNTITLAKYTLKYKRLLWQTDYTLETLEQELKKNHPL